MSEVVTTDDENETDDCSSVVSTTMADRCVTNEDCTKDLIAMILQYMDATGFQQSYKTFWNECSAYGFPLPQVSKSQQVSQQEECTPRSALVSFGPRESNLLFKYFDFEEADLLLEQWNKFISALDEDQEEDFKKITFFVRIFVAIIPFRKNESGEKKTKALAELRDFFQKKSDEFSTDEKMLSLFALPFVADPAVHPVFKDIFHDSWKSKLRIQMNLSIKRFCEYKNVPTPSSCDLVQLYMRRRRTTRMEEIEDDEFEEEEVDGLGSPSRCVPRSTTMSSHRKTIHEDLKKTESTLLDVELRYHKLLKVTAEMVAALEAAVEGRDQDMSALRGRVTSVFPELFTAFQQQQQQQQQKQQQKHHHHHQEGSGDGQQVFQVEVNPSDDDDDDDNGSFSEPDYDTESERDHHHHDQSEIVTNTNSAATIDNDPQHEIYPEDSNRDTSSPKYSSNNGNNNKKVDDDEIYYEPTPRPRQSPPKSCHRPHLRTLRRPPSSKFNVNARQENERESCRQCDHEEGTTTATTPPSSTRRSETRAIDKRLVQSCTERDPQRQCHHKNNPNEATPAEEGGRRQNHHRQQQQNSPKKRSYSQSVHLTRPPLSSGPPPPSMGPSSINNAVMDTNKESSVHNRKRWVVKFEK